MEHHGQYGHDTARVDEQVAGHGTATTGVPGATTGGDQMQPMKEDHKTDGLLRRSGSSSSSSSSEDDGMGGRRKKGMKEKIKEKLPGGNKDNQATATTGTTAASTGEKKGVMEKIKEKLPGKN